MEKLDPAMRMKLMKFVCSFAWTDLRVTREELGVIERMAERGDFSAEERQSIAGWLHVPPPPEDVDPSEILPEHRQLFYEAAEAVVASDGIVSAERDALELFRELLA